MNMITHRVSPQQARYTPMGGREKCARCRFYIAPKWCGHVTGPVSPMGWCKYFSQEMRRQFGGSQVVAIGPPGATLDLGFMTPGTLDSRITFTRASTATYTDASGTIQPAAINQPRWDYAGGVLRGLLIEEARTNIVTASTGLMSPWSTGGAALTVASGVAPDGTNTMTKLAEDATNGLHYFLNQYAVVASTAYTISVYAKAAERRYLAVGFDDGGSNGVTCTFDLQTGTTVSIGQGTGVLIGVQMLPVGNGVYRCSTSGTVASTVLRAFCNLWINASTQFFPSYQGVAGNGVLIWGMQIEQGAFPTSYIPTTSVVVTRSVDLASMSFTPAASGTYRAEFIPAGAAGGLPYIVSGNAGSPAMAIGADTRLVASIRSGASVFSAVAPAMTFNAVNKTAFGWLTGASKAAVNGTLLGANAVALTVTGTTVQLGSDGVTPGNNALNGGLRRVSYWPRQLSDAEMQQVTT